MPRDSQPGPRDGLTLSKLSRRVMVSNGNVTGLMDRLEQQRQVVRVPHRTDRRASRVRLTEGGRRVLLPMAAAHQDWMKEAFARLAPEDGPALMAALACVEIAVLAVCRQWGSLSHEGGS